ncbi:hypothetical protein ATERTT37_003765 [Aspergillus terreus]
MALKDEDPDALRALIMASSKMYEMGARFLYDTVSIRFAHLSDLCDTVAQYTDSGLGRPFLTHATRLEIVALPERVRRIRGGEGGGGRYKFGFPDKTTTLQDFFPPTVGSFMERFMTRFDLPGYDLHWSEYPGYYSEKDWKPLISLVSKLPHLKSIHYAVANSFPLSLLDAVHHHHPSCEINIWSPQCLRLNIPGVNQKYTFNDSRQPSRIYDDTLDMEILQSPCLRAIKIDYPLVLGSHDAFQPHNIVDYRIAEHCPNLKDLRVPIRRSKGSEEEVRIYRSLGQFPQLQNLILDLYGNPRPVLSREEGQYSDEGLGVIVPVHVSLKDALVNFAVDRDLATALKKVITTTRFAVGL